MAGKLLVAAPALAAGCSYPEPGFNSPDPAALIPAIVAASETRDRRAIPDLIRSLDSQDPAVRFAAIQALERITGQTLGYDYAAPETDRRRQVDAWVRWYQEQPGRSSELTSDPVASR